jgi:glutaredoxin
MAKEFFTKHNVAYTEHDVFADLAARKEMVDKSHQMGVPVIDIGGNIIVGFDQKAVKEALGMKD